MTLIALMALVSLTSKLCLSVDRRRGYHLWRHREDVPAVFPS